MAVKIRVSRCRHEEELQRLEKTRKNAVEMEKEEDAKADEAEASQQKVKGYFMRSTEPRPEDKFYIGG